MRAVGLPPWHPHRAVISAAKFVVSSRAERQRGDLF